MTPSDWSELRILDRDEGQPELVIKLKTLLAYLGRTMPDCLRGDWEILHADYGHGHFVCSVEEQLDSAPSVTIPYGQLLAALLPRDEYFENVRMRRTDGFLELGRHDSTFVFVRGSRETLEAIGSGFEETEIGLSAQR